MTHILSPKTTDAKKLFFAVSKSSLKETPGVINSVTPLQFFWFF